MPELIIVYGFHELESARVIPYYGGSVVDSGNSVVAKRINGDSKIFEIKENNDRNKVHNIANKWVSRIWDINPPINEDKSYPIFHDKGAVGGLMKGFFGYNGDPSLIEVISWVLVSSGLGFTWRKVAV